MTEAPPILDLTAQTPDLRPDAPFNDTRAWTRANLTPDLWTVPVIDEARDELRAVVEAGLARSFQIPQLFTSATVFDNLLVASGIAPNGSKRN